MNKLSFLKFAIGIAVCAIVISSCNENPAGELYIHYTPEELDPKTQAVINGMKTNPVFPTTAEEMAAAAKELAGYSYEEYSAVYPPFSDEMLLYEKMKAEGVEVGVLYGKGLWHVAAIFPMPAEQQYLDLFVNFIKSS